MKKIFLLPILCLFGLILNANPCALMQDDVEGYITHVCNGNDGAIDITIHNAMAPFEFCWLVLIIVTAQNIVLSSRCLLC